MDRAFPNYSVSLTPDFSRVFDGRKTQNRFNGFPDAEKPLKRFLHECDRLHPAEAGC